MITTINIATVCHHTEILHYYWLYFPHCTFHPCPSPTFFDNQPLSLIKTGLIILYCDHYDDCGKILIWDMPWLLWGKDSQRSPIWISHPVRLRFKMNHLICWHARESDKSQPGGNRNHVCCGYDLIDVVTDVFTASPSSPNASPSRKADVCGRLSPVTAARNGS